MEDKAKQIQELGARILRPERRICNEDLISSELAMAVMSDPLGKIRHACEATFLLSEKELAKADITLREQQIATMLHTICLALQNAYVHQLIDTYGRIIDKWASIAWPFPRSEAKRWLEEWASDLEFTYWQGGQGDEKREAELKEIKDKYERMYEVTKSQCTMPTLQIFRTRFEMYAIPHITALMQKTLHLVSPSSYEMAMWSLQREAKKTKETGT